MRAFICALLLSTVCASVAQMPGPILSDVTAAQRRGTFYVDITYGIENVAGSLSLPLAVAVEISTNGGVSYFTPASLTGDVGENISAGSGKKITWNAAAAGLPAKYYSNVRAKLTGRNKWWSLQGGWTSYIGGTYNTGCSILQNGANLEFFIRNEHYTGYFTPPSSVVSSMPNSGTISGNGLVITWTDSTWERGTAAHQNGFSTAEKTFALDLAPNVTVHGRVRSALDRQPLADVLVSLAGSDTLTDQEGKFSLADISLESGDLLTAAKTNYAPSTVSVAPLPGATIVVLPDILLGKGSAPTVSGLKAKVDGIFLAGVPVNNKYTATVDWNSNTADTVRFFANGVKIKEITGAAPSYQAEVYMPTSFAPALFEQTNNLKVVASAAGKDSEPMEMPVVLIPLPDAALKIPGFSVFSEEDEVHLAVDWSFPDPKFKETINLPVLGKFGLEIAANASLDYTVTDGEWEASFGAGVEGKGKKGKRDRRPAGAPKADRPPTMKLFVGKREIEGELKGGVRGHATLKEGLSLEEAFGEGEITATVELGRVGLLDLLGPGLSTIAGSVPGLADVAKSTSILLLVKPGVEGELVFSLDPEIDFKSGELTGKIALEASFEPDLGIVDMRVYVGGEPSVTFKLPPPLLKQLGFRVYAGAEFEAWIFELGPCEYVFVDVKYPEASGSSMLAMNAGETSVIRGYAGKFNPAWRPMNRRYLAAGPAVFVADLAGATLDGVVNGSRMANQLAAFKLMGSLPVRGAIGGTANSTRQALSGPQILSTTEQANLTLVTNVFPNSKPALAALSGTENLLLLYTADNGDTNTLQCTDIRWTRWDGTNWGMPVAIQTNTQAEFSPQVAFDGNGHAVALWERVADTNFATVDLGAMAAQMEIVWSRQDKDTGVWSSPQALTTNSVLDHQPLLCGPMQDGSLMAVWIRNEAHLRMGMSGATSNDLVLWSRWSSASSSWSSPAVLASNIIGRTSQDLAGASNRALYVWSADLDGDLSGSGDVEMFARQWLENTWGPVVQLSLNSVADRHAKVAVDANRSATIVWQRDTNLVMDFSSCELAAFGDTAVAYTSWTNQSQGGSGLGPWLISLSGTGSVFIGSSTSNGGGAASGGIDTGGRSWGLRSSGSLVEAQRTLLTPLRPGDVLQVKLDNGWIDNGSVGIALLSGTTQRWYFGFTGGGSDYYELNNTSTVEWTDSGLQLELTLLTEDQYKFSVTRLSDSVSGVYTGLFSAAGAIDTLRFWHSQQGSAINHDYYINDIAVLKAPVFSGSPVLVRGDTDGAEFSDFELTCGPLGNLVLLRQGMSDDGSDAYYMVYDPIAARWSRDARLFMDAALERSFAPVWDSLGNLTFAYNKVQMTKGPKTVELEGGGSVTISNVPQSGSVDLCVTRRALIQDLAMLPGDFTAEGLNFQPEDPITLTALVRNQGDVAVSNAVVEFFDGDPDSGGVLIGSATISGWLDGADTNVVSVSWVVPDVVENRILYAVINRTGAASEFNATNNAQSLAVGGVDLAVSVVNYSTETNGSMRVVAQVKNIGSPGATNSTLTIRRTDGTGINILPAILASAGVPALEPGRLAQIALDLPPGTHPGDEVFFALQSDESGLTGDVDMGNNVRVFSAYLWLDADGDGLPDYYENQWDFLDPNDPDDAGLDNDGDHSSNRDEYRAGTSSDDPSSYLRMNNLASPTNSQSGFRVVWGSESNRLYTLQRTLELSNSSVFSNIVAHIRSTPPENVFDDTTATNKSSYFYRILLE